MTRERSPSPDGAGNHCRHFRYGPVQGGKLTFDSTALAFGLLADGKVSPATAPYVVAESWRTGYITSVGREENGLRLTVDTSLRRTP